MTAVVDVTAANGVPFRFVFYRPGETGPYPAAVDEERSQVEVYDARYPHTEHGQFVGARYYPETLLGLDRYGHSSGGLDLVGYEPSWKVDATTMVVVRAWLRHQFATLPAGEFPSGCV